MAAQNIEYRFIDNVGEYFPSGFFGDDFYKSIVAASGLTADELKKLAEPFKQLRPEYDKFKNYIVNNQPRPRDANRHTHDFHTRLLNLLGYDTTGPYEWCDVDSDAGAVIPVRQILRRGTQPKLYVMEMQHMIKTAEAEPAGIFDQQYATATDDIRPDAQKYRAAQWADVFTLPAGCRLSPAVVSKAIDAIFLMPEDRRPHYILLLAGNMVFLMDSDKWSRGAYLQFSLDELFYQASAKSFGNLFALFALLVRHDSLAPDAEAPLMDTINEEGYRNAFAVTQDLRDGVILAIETLANEALYYKKNVAHIPFGKYNEKSGLPKDDPDAYDVTDDSFEDEVRDDCLTIVYRLLFIFFAESRPDLGILPMNDEVYRLGYSLDMLRDMECKRLNAQNENGYFFDASIHSLFNLLYSGHRSTGTRDFAIRKIDSPLFCDANLRQLRGVKIRNKCWQQIIRSLSLSKRGSLKDKRSPGRISYANLGINQLGSVYESLLAYRGFYAAEDYIEVFNPDKPDEGTYLVPYSRMDNFAEREVVRDETGAPRKMKKGTFVYRLNGRDRKKSASFYTPEVLTRSTVRYALKPILDEVAAGRRKATDLLDLKILEPAMGAAAFQNEVINQVAEAYLTYQQLQLQQQHPATRARFRIEPDHYADELQKVKAYIATHNVYGIDLNPTAIELGKLSLWLNVIHSQMETPFFSNRLALGNAVVGAWLKTYRAAEVRGIAKKKGGKDVLEPNEWWTRAPRRVQFAKAPKRGVIRAADEVYHFLLPDKNMLPVRGISDHKKGPDAELNKTRIVAMNNIVADWTRPITAADWQKLTRLSDKIDHLLAEYYDFQARVEAQTQNRMDLWGVPYLDATLSGMSNYAEKERLNNLRYDKSNPYLRLKSVMDLWTALWFWPLDKAGQLPTRDELWADMEAMLDVKDEDLEAAARRATTQVAYTAFPKTEGGTLPFTQAELYGGLFALDQTPKPAPAPEAEDEAATPDPIPPQAEQRRLAERAESAMRQQLSQHQAEGIVSELTDTLTRAARDAKEELLAQTKGQGRAMFQDSERFRIAREQAGRYRFFHPMLEFIEVFFAHGGFDVAVGNPPWVKLSFNEQDIVAERYPEVVIRPTSGPEVRKKIATYLADPELRDLYQAEQHEQTCTSAFLNATANYPLLTGQQSNLYKCVLTNALDLVAPDSGYVGILCPDGCYDDPNGRPIRQELYRRLRFHFQYENDLRLFSEVHSLTRFAIHIFGPERKSIDFLNINNLFHPQTVEECFASSGVGLCGGIKDADGHYNLTGHSDRIVHYTAREIALLSKTFEGGEADDCAKLVSIHAQPIINVLEKISDFPTHLKEKETLTKKCLDETAAVNNGSMKPNLCVPSVDAYQAILSGPHFYVGNPYYKNPRNPCFVNSDYDTLNLTTLPANFIPRVKYAPVLSKEQYLALPTFRGFQKGVDAEGKPLYDSWMDYYKVGFRRMLSLAGERTLICAVLPRKTAHINTVVSAAFRSGDDCVEMQALCSSILLDFYIKTVGAGDLMPSRMAAFPIGVAKRYQSPLYVRTLLLNCLTESYADLWRECWRGEFARDAWSSADKRLKPFSTLTPEWSAATPLRKDFERRMALVETDVLVAMALGLTLQDLKLIYTIQFPVLQQNEQDTWYDARGQIVFTASKGLPGVGLDRPVWEQLRGKQTDSDPDTYIGAQQTIVHTISPAKSQMYAGQQVTFQAPFTRPNRLVDYERAWAWFEEHLGE